MLCTIRRGAPCTNSTCLYPNVTCLPTPAVNKNNDSGNRKTVCGPANDAEASKLVPEGYELQDVMQIEKLDDVLDRDVKVMKIGVQVRARQDRTGLCLGLGCGVQDSGLIWRRLVSDFRFQV